MLTWTAGLTTELVHACTAASHARPGNRMPLGRPVLPLVKPMTASASARRREVGHRGSIAVRELERNQNAVAVLQQGRTRPGLPLYDQRMIYERLKDEVPRTGIGQSRTVFRDLRKASWL